MADVCQMNPFADFGVGSYRRVKSYYLSLVVLLPIEKARPHMIYTAPYVSLATYNSSP
jgi:hypothetical protein